MSKRKETTNEATKKAASGRASAKKGSAKKGIPKKSALEKAPSEKAPSKKATSRKGTSKKTASRKTSSKKSTAVKSSAPKSSSKSRKGADTAASDAVKAATTPSIPGASAVNGHPSAAERPHPKRTLAIRGASLHNLKNISLDLPRNRLIVFTGLSGSGKSSLAFDTIYAEGQRRYVESLSAYARQFLSRMAKPQVESISGLAPAVAIEQQTLQRNPRSTVATTTEVYDYMRLLFGRIGRTICRNCGTEVMRDTPRIVQEKLATLKEGTRLYFLFPMPDHPSHSLDDELEALRGRGFFRIVPKGTTDIVDLTEETAGETLRKYSKEELAVLVDRIVWRDDEATLSRVAEASEGGFREGGGGLTVLEVGGEGRTFSFNRRYECSTCGTKWLEPEPRLFSFNNPYGACPECQGFGRAVGIDMDLVIPDQRKSIRQGAIQPFSTPKHSSHFRDLVAISREAGLDASKPFSELSERELDIVMEGHGEYIGIKGFFSMIEKNTYKMHYRVLLSRYRGYTTCFRCKGSRLRTSATQVFVGGKRIGEIAAMPIDEARAWFEAYRPTEHEEMIAGRILDEIRKRLRFLDDVGLGYLRLDRLSHSLSGGEMQRINLATSIGSSLVGAMYVLDEPSIGLHPRDTGRLIRILKELRDLGNTVIVVEHDPDIIRAADVIVEMGPGAGEHGGDIIFIGTVDEMMASEQSKTGAWLSGRESRTPRARQSQLNEGWIGLEHATLHNLKDVSFRFPTKRLTAVTGVSGSGKSTLIHDVFWKVASYSLGGIARGEDRRAEVTGINLVDSIEMIDQSPIGRTPRSNPATYTKAFDAIRDLFSSTSHARLNGWKPGFFSFNVAGGRCDVCSGEGYVTVDMQVLADIQLPCDACHGTRYKSEILNAKYRGKSIVDVLEMTVDEGIAFFEGDDRITRRLRALADVGLGYIRLGQPATTLSGGEAQRVKLASHLVYHGPDERLFILDEPTTGLHMQDVAVLLDAFDALIRAGNTILVIEHNLDVIAAADWVVELGPEGGAPGGVITAMGDVSHIASLEDSHTGRFLATHIEQRDR